MTSWKVEVLKPELLSTGWQYCHGVRWLILERRRAGPRTRESRTEGKKVASCRETKIR